MYRFECKAGPALAPEEQLSGGCVTQKLCQLLKERMERERHDMEDACDRMRLAFENK